MNMKNYYIFWLSQTVSQLGSSMTGFALGVWAFSQTKSPFTMSIISFCCYLPYIIISMFAGVFIDTHSKKKIMLIADSVAALCTLFVFAMLRLNCFQIYHIFIVNLITSFMNAFQSPASKVAVGMMVPEEKFEKVSGMNSFSNSVIMIFAPILGATVCSILGLAGVIFIDLSSFFIAFVTLLFFIMYCNLRKCI